MSQWAIWQSDILSSKMTPHISPFLVAFFTFVFKFRERLERQPWQISKSIWTGALFTLQRTFQRLHHSVIQKNIYNFIEVLQYLSTESTHCMVFWCALVPDHTCYTTLTEPSQKRTKALPVWFTSRGVQAAHWASGATNGGPTVWGAKLLGQRHDFVSSFAALFLEFIIQPLSKE